ncbi:MAG: TadE family protein [Planctomycetota bacterium]
MADLMITRPVRGALSKLRAARRRGASLVEAAFVIPVLMAVTIGGIEFGTLLHLRGSMQHAAREAARVLAVQGGTMAEAEATAADLLPDNDLLWEYNFTRPAPDSLDRSVIAEIAIPFRDISMADFFGLYGENDYLRVSVTMRSEQQQ